MARESSGHMSTQRVQPSMHFDSSMVTGTSARWGAKGMAVSRKRLGKRSEGAVQQAAHRDAVAAEADELQVDGAAVGEVGEAFQHQDGRAARGFQYGGGVRVRVHRLQGDLGVAETLAGDRLQEAEDVGVLQVGAEQGGAEVERDVGEVEGQGEAVEAAQALDVEDIGAGVDLEAP